MIYFHMGQIQSTTTNRSTGLSTFANCEMKKILVSQNCSLSIHLCKHYQGLLVYLKVAKDSDIYMWNMGIFGLFSRDQNQGTTRQQKVI
uniref:Uncharacterized protein n=1 Tax=Arundo donax TaxID=35708 RepID=A0A0A9HI01_ARUDO